MHFLFVCLIDFFVNLILCIIFCEYIFSELKNKKNKVKILKIDKNRKIVYFDMI